MHFANRAPLLLRVANVIQEAADIIRYGPGVRSQRRILPGNRLLQILYLLTHIGDLLVDNFETSCCSLVWLVASDDFARRKQHLLAFGDLAIAALPRGRTRML